MSADAPSDLRPDELPPADRLAHAVSCLARHLPDQLGVLLASSRFDDGRAALARLAEPGRAAQAVAGMPPGEADRLLGVLLDRWDAVAAVEIDPAAIVVGPSEVWVARKPRLVEYRVVTIGVADGWTAEWSSGSSTLEVPVPRSDQEVELRHTVRVMGRAGGRRQVLVGERRVLARRPVVTFEPGGTRLVVTDHRGRPAGDTDIVVGTEAHRTDAQGGIVVDRSVGTGPARPAVLVDGQPAAAAGPAP